MSTIKTIAYVDGYNLYYGLMDRRYFVPNDPSPTPLRKYLWLNLSTFIASFLPPNYDLAWIHYFTAPVKNRPDSLARQLTYWKALESIPNLTIHKGHYLRKGNSYEEKQTDVQFALQMYDDALHDDELGAMLLLSADSDQVPTVKRIIALTRDIELFVIFPPCRHADALRDLIEPGKCFKTKYRRLAENQFPDVVSTSTFSVTKPLEWV